MKLNILKHSSEDCMIFPTKALFGNLFILNIIFVFQEALYRECKRFIKNLGSLEGALVLCLKSAHRQNSWYYELGFSV